MTFNTIVLTKYLIMHVFLLCSLQSLSVCFRLCDNYLSGRGLAVICTSYEEGKLKRIAQDLDSFFFFLCLPKLHVAVQQFALRK